MIDLKAISRPARLATALFVIVGVYAVVRYGSELAYAAGKFVGSH